MIKFFKKIISLIVDFVCEQFLVLLFMIALGLKLFFINTYILKITWPFDQYIYGVIFGFISAAIIFLPALFAKKHKIKLAFFIASLISIIILIDLIYFSYFIALPNIGLLNLLSQASGFVPAISGLLNWWLILYLADIALAIFLLKSKLKIFKKIKKQCQNIKSSFKASLLFLGLVLFTFTITFFNVGGINKINGIINNSNDTVGTAQYYGVLMAHVIDFVRLIEENTTSLSPTKEKLLSNWVRTNKPLQTDNDLTGIAKGKNVIMIQVESLGGFVLNQVINGKEVTPNLDKLAKNSQFYPNNRFITGAGHTSDSDFVANTSYFPLNDAAVFVRYGNDDFSSLPKTLVTNGYSTYAYHGYNRNFWNRDTALNSLGYQKFYAADNYPKGSTINLGLNDGDFLSNTADYIVNQPKPSFSYIITLSSHVPFAITDHTKALNINLNDYPNQVGGYLENINYTDRMLGDFFAKLKIKKLYDDSLIIIYGDHTPVLPKFTAGTINYDPKTVQSKEVPLIIKLPNNTTDQTYINQGTSLDIAPTIFDLLDIKTNQLMFGQSLFANNRLPVCSDQLVVFLKTDNCDTALIDEKNQSAMIIKYNQFNNL